MVKLFVQILFDICNSNKVYWIRVWASRNNTKSILKIQLWITFKKILTPKTIDEGQTTLYCFNDPTNAAFCLDMMQELLSCTLDNTAAANIQDWVGRRYLQFLLLHLFIWNAHYILEKPAVLLKDSVTNENFLFSTKTNEKSWTLYNIDETHGRIYCIRVVYILESILKKLITSNACLMAFSVVL